MMQAEENKIRISADVGKIRCLFIVPSLKRGGAETQLIDLVNRLDKGKFEKHLVVLEENLDQLDKVDAESVELHHLPKKKKLDWAIIKDVRSIIDSKNIDIIHATMQYSSLIGWLAMRTATHLPGLVAAIHTTKNVGIKEEFFDRVVYRPVLRRCNKVIFVCNNQREYWLKKYPELELKSKVIYNGIDTDKFMRNDRIAEGKELEKYLGLPEEVFVVTCIAGFRKEKGHEILIRAFLSLPENARLLLAGGGPLMENMRNLVERLGLARRVVFLGNLSDVRPVLSITDVMVLASTAVETFSIAMLEAMAMEVPVLASDIGGLSEAIKEGSTGSLVPPGKVEALAGVLSAYCAIGISHEIRKNCREMVEKSFTSQQMVCETELLLIDMKRTAP